MRLLVAIAVAIAAAASLVACGVRSHTETEAPGALGYRGHVYLGVGQLQLPVHLEDDSATPVPEGFSRAGEAVVLDGGAHGSYVSERGWKVPVFSIAGQPERIASPNSWGGGNVYYNEYELSPKAKWKR